MFVLTSLRTAMPRIREAKFLQFTQGRMRNLALLITRWRWQARCVDVPPIHLLHGAVVQSATEEITGELKALVDLHTG